MTIQPFTSDKEVVTFATAFLANRVTTFRKDIRICMTADEDRHHAYVPALITCIGFADFLSGLYAGTLKDHRLPELKTYAKKFMNPVSYDDFALEILYEMFRHKLAHFAHLYAVFDTSTASAKAHSIRQRRRHITWIVCAAKQNRPVEHHDYPTQYLEKNFPVPRHLKKAPRPWRMAYDCKVWISIPRLRVDIIKSIYGASGYLNAVKADAQLRVNFPRCMKTIYPA